MNEEELRVEVEAFLTHSPLRPSHAPDAHDEEFDLTAIRDVGNITSGFLRSPGSADPAKDQAYAAFIRDGARIETPNADIEAARDKLTEPLLRLIRTSRRRTAAMPFLLRFGTVAGNDWLFAEMAAPYLALELRTQLTRGNVSEVIEHSLDAAALARDHEMMVALGSGGKIPWIATIYEVLQDALNEADQPTLQRFIEGGVVINTWPSVSDRIAMSRVLGPPLKHIREGERLLELDLPDDVHCEIERASAGFGCMFPAPLYCDLDFLWGGFAEWRAAAFNCAETVDGGPNVVREETDRIEPLMREDARLLPLHSWLRIGGSLSSRQMDSLLRWRLLLVHAACRLEELAGRTRPKNPAELLPELPKRWDSEIMWGDDELVIEAGQGGVPWMPNEPTRFTVALTP